MEELSILRTARYRNGRFEVEGTARTPGTGDVEADLATAWAISGSVYDRFHRTDRLSRLVLLCADALLNGLPDDDDLHERTGILLTSGKGSLDSDMRHYQGLQQGQVSPGTFVYTLPNIALGEMTIRHKLFGPGMCLQSANPDLDRMRDLCRWMLGVDGMRRVVCGRADIFAGEVSATFLLVGSGGRPWNMDELNALHR